LSRRGRAAGRRRGFTLIEVLAVVAILALVAVLVVPNLGALRTRRLKVSAERLAAEIELARQRAVATGIPHRIYFDLDAARYRIEWLGAEQAAVSVAPVAAAMEYDVGGSAELPLAAPASSILEFTPVSDTFGNLRELEDGVFVASLETVEGAVESGEAQLVFDRDGSADYSEIVLQEEGGESLRLAVLPLDDSVRFLDSETLQP
jgi:type II secretion system protein H